MNIKHSINKFGLMAAIFSAGLGILLTILFLITEEESFAIFGFMHLFPSVLFHGIVWLLIVLNAFRKPTDYKEHLIVLFIIPLNIPLAFLCAYVAFEFGSI